MCGQDEPKPEWVSSARSCFFIELILKYFSLPKLEWKKKQLLWRRFLIQRYISQFQNKPRILYLNTYQNRNFKNSVSIIKPFSTIKCQNLYTVQQNIYIANLRVISVLTPSLLLHKIHFLNPLIQLPSSKSILVCGCGRVEYEDFFM